MPTAVTDSSIRPSTRSATPVSLPRGCGDSDLQALADERLQPARGAVERVALGHVREGSQPRYDRAVSGCLRQSDVGVWRPGLNIAAVARRTGIGADTLRKWEQRYGVLHPGRTPAGSVATTRWTWPASRAPCRLAEGLRIGEAAALLEDEAIAAPSAVGLREAIVQTVGAEDTPSPGGARRAGVRALRGRGAVEDVLAPALRTIGDRWREGPACIAEEHLLSEAVHAACGGCSPTAAAVRGTAVRALRASRARPAGAAVLPQADGWLAVSRRRRAARVVLHAGDAAGSGAALPERRVRGVDHARHRPARRAAAPEQLRVLVGGAGAATTCGSARRSPACAA